jgi:hypothetical protein
MAKHLRVRQAQAEACCIDYDDDPQGRYTSPKSPTNLAYARSHAELAGRKEPPLSEGLSFTEELETKDYWNMN